MATWSSRPPDGHELPTLPILRPAAGGKPIEGVILSDEIVGRMLHFMGRTVPHVDAHPDCPDCDTRAVPPVHCARHACPGCAALRPMRWEGYVHVWNPRTGGTAMACITEGTHQAYEIYQKQHGTLRGCGLKLMRNGFRANSPITVVLKRADNPPETLPRALDLRPILNKIWGVQQRPAPPQGSEAEQLVSTVEATFPIEDRPPPKRPH